MLMLMPMMIMIKRERRGEEEEEGRVFLWFASYSPLRMEATPNKANPRHVELYCQAKKAKGKEGRIIVEG